MPSSVMKTSWIAPSAYRSSMASARSISVRTTGKSATRSGWSTPMAMAEPHAAPSQ